jgi:hypothetical protein
LHKEIEHIIKSIKSKTADLIAAKTAALKEKEQLTQQLVKANTALEKQAKQISDLQQQVQALQLLQTNMHVEDKKELGKTIDKHIASINKTITLLSE